MTVDVLLLLGYLLGVVLTMGSVGVVLFYWADWVRGRKFVSDEVRERQEFS